MGASPALAEGAEGTAAPTIVVDEAAAAAAKADAEAAAAAAKAAADAEAAAAAKAAADAEAAKSVATTGTGTGPATTPPANTTPPPATDTQITTQSTNTEDASKQPPAKMAARSISVLPDPPYLRWITLDADGNPAEDATITVESRVNLTVTDDGTDLPWEGALKMTVLDNVGQEGYLGQDRDPAIGAFLVNEFINDADQSRTPVVVLNTGTEYRAQGTVPSGDVALWTAIPITQNADEPVTELMFAPKAKEPGFVVFSVPDPPTGGAVINVNLRTLRGAAAGTAATAGIKFQLYTDQSGTSGGNTYYTAGVAVVGAWATCTTDTDGDCSFSVPASGIGKNYWVVPSMTTGAGSFLSKHLVTGNNTSSGGDRFAATPYSFRTTTVQANTTYQIPGNGVAMPTRTLVGDQGIINLFSATTSNRWAHLGTDQVASLNPIRYTPTCNVGLKVALVVDLSTSMTYNENEGLKGAQAASKAFATAFVDKGVTLGAYTFGSDANGAIVSPTVVTSSNIGSINSTLGGMAVSGIQYTNWDKGLEQVAGSGYNIVVVLTDGNPTRWRNGSGNNSWTNLQGLEEAILSANLLKSQNSQIIAFGVGDNLNSAMPQNLQSVTGTTAWAPGGQIAQSDYAITNNWSVVSEQLGVLASTLTCEATVQVKKMLKSGTDLTPGQGWTFTPTQTGAGTMTPAGAQTTVASGFLPGPWQIKFTDKNHTANLQIAETNHTSDYVFDSVACTNGGVAMTGVTSSQTFTLAGLKSGDRVVCTVVNRLAPTSVSVSKKWVVKDGAGQTLYTVHEPTQTGDATLPSGMGAQLTLTGPGSAAASNQGWGVARVGYSVNDTVTVDEVPLGSASNIVTRTGCSLTTAAVTSQKLGSGAAESINVSIVGNATFTSPGLKSGTNTFEVTNTVTCITTVTLLKHVADGTAPADTWELTATNTATSVGISVDGNELVTAANTITVTPGQGYMLSEAFATPGSSMAYLFDRLERCTLMTGTTCSTWATVDVNTAIQATVGQQEVYRFVNKLAPSIQVPFTGGISSELYAGIGLSVAVLALLLGSAAWTRRVRVQAVRR